MNDTASSPRDLSTGIQVSKTTVANRYPKVFAHATDLVRATTNAAKVLSFGCSSGLEPRTLADRYFTLPEDRILGVDISPEALETAKVENPHARIRYELSNDASIGWHAPFDVIFAMSVLCRWPDTQDMSDISGLFPFSRFESVLAKLDGTLRVGGVLAVYNSNYLVSDVSFAHRYEPLPTPGLDESGYVKKFQPDGRVAVEGSEQISVFVKRA